jgi:peptidoglycan-associated lipoprotein
MNIKIIALPFLLAACSSTSLQDTPTKDPPTIDNRTKQNTNGTRNTDVIVNANPEPVVEVRKNKIPDRADPTTLFQESSIYFDLDEYTVKESFIPLLKQHAEFLIKNPNEFVFIQGHTDERGGTEYNLALGQRRANAVKMALSRLGVSDQQMEAFSYGSTKPRAAGSTEEAWAENRRVDLDYRN